MENLIVTHREMPPKSLGAETSNDTSKLSRHDFPKEFVFGSASSAYQFEGAAKEGNRGLSIWDTFTDREPGAVKDGSNGTMAVNSYHLYKEDVQLIKQVGLQAHRISISWSRVLPGGRLDSGVNKEGIKYYSDLIDELLANDIEPFVTLFHFDVPQALEDEYGGFLSPRIVKDFQDYAELCFWQFGDRVKYWITINEPWSFSNGGYATGTLAPGRGRVTSSSEHTVPPSRCSPWRNSRVSRNGNPGTEPYLVAHHLLLAHAAAVDLYRQKFQEYQEGKIGISHVVQWAEPLDDSKDSDVKAALRAFDFNFGWFLEPLTSGEYPQSMRTLVGSRLPKFSAEESEKVKGSYDFMGLNYYTSTYVTSSAKPTNEPPSYTTDPQVTYPTERNGIPIGPKDGSAWINVYPEGLYKVLIYIKKTYNIPVIYITENGIDHQNIISQTLSEARVDNERIKYHHDHLIYLLKAINDGVNVKGYFIWSLLDNFEWSEGYTVRFGIIYVDRQNNFLRYPKESAVWFKRLLNRKHPEKLSKRHVEENDGDHLKKKPRK